MEGTRGRPLLAAVAATAKTFSSYFSNFNYFCRQLPSLCLALPLSFSLSLLSFSALSVSCTPIWQRLSVLYFYILIKTQFALT